MMKEVKMVKDQRTKDIPKTTCFGTRRQANNAAMAKDNVALKEHGGAFSVEGPSWFCRFPLYAIWYVAMLVQERLAKKDLEIQDLRNKFRLERKLTLFIESHLG